MVASKAGLQSLGRLGRDYEMIRLNKTEYIRSLCKGKAQFYAMNSNEQIEISLAIGTKAAIILKTFFMPLG